jgi:hypothetical protein
MIGSKWVKMGQKGLPDPSLTKYRVLIVINPVTFPHSRPKLLKFIRLLTNSAKYFSPNSAPNYSIVTHLVTLIRRSLSDFIAPCQAKSHAPMGYFNPPIF